MPCPASSPRHPERGLVVEEISEDLSNDHADPSGHGEEGELFGGEAVPAGFFGRFEVDC